MNETSSGDIPHKVLVGSVRRWWAVIVTTVGVIGYGYQVDAQVRANTARLNKLEAMSVATYVNASLACLQSGAVGCVTYHEVTRRGLEVEEE